MKIIKKMVEEKKILILNSLLCLIGICFIVVVNLIPNNQIVGEIDEEVLTPKDKIKLYNRQQFINENQPIPLEYQIKGIDDKTLKEIKETHINRTNGKKFLCEEYNNLEVTHMRRTSMVEGSTTEILINGGWEDLNKVKDNCRNIYKDAN